MNYSADIMGRQAEICRIIPWISALNLLWERNPRIMKDKILHVLLRALPMALVLAVLAGTAVWLNRADEDETASDASRMVYASAEVTAVLADNAQEDYQNAEGRRVGDQELEIRILSGDHKDEIMTVTNYMSALFNVDVDRGDRIIVRIMTDEDGSYYASVFNYDRGIVLGVFLLIFFALLAVLGGKKGIGALAGLLLTLGCIWFILIPCLIRGVPAVPVTIGVSAVAAAAGLIFLNGYSKKTLCAVCSCVGGVLAAGIAAAAVGTLSPMNGFNMQEAENLILYGRKPDPVRSRPWAEDQRAACVRSPDLRAGSGDGRGAGNCVICVGDEEAESGRIGEKPVPIRDADRKGRYGNHGEYADSGVCRLFA